MFTWRRRYLSSGTSSDIMHVEDIQISPDPPHVGKSVEVTGHGQVSSLIKEGAYADVNVKSGILTVYSQRANLCQEARDLGWNIQCPVSAGAYTFDESMTIPSNIPRGKYIVKVNAFTVDHAPIFCLQTTMDLST
ncbi:hypothetical protein H0H93_004591 [Arthromyces matolae]|nr:hypothetical protein H0H93_004591 [Arthromyces matolae]